MAKSDKKIGLKEEPATNNKEVQILLYSGGIDSYLLRKVEPFAKPIYINNNSIYSQAEMALLDEDVLVLQGSGGDLFKDKEGVYIPARNLQFMITALQWAVSEGYNDIELILGSLKEDHSPDKTTAYLELAEKVLYFSQNISEEMGSELKELEGKETKIKINTKYKEFTREDLINELKERDCFEADELHKAFSCYHPVNNKACLTCRACIRKAATIAAHGGKPALNITRDVISFLSYQASRKDYPRAEDHKLLLKAVIEAIEDQRENLLKLYTEATSNEEDQKSIDREQKAHDEALAEG
jgi:7-cyano-7-deazaguanine synthase in queuosine biosynthesis